MTKADSTFPAVSLRLVDFLDQISLGWGLVSSATQAKFKSPFAVSFHSTRSDTRVESHSGVILD